MSSNLWLNYLMQISTIQFESMQPIGVEILSSIVDKVEDLHFVHLS